MLYDKASKTLYISSLQLVVWLVLMLRGFEAQKGVAKSSEPKMQEGILFFK